MRSLRHRRRSFAAGAVFVVLIIGGLGACLPVPPSPRSCAITRPPAGLHLDPFYKKFCSVRGIPIVAASVVPDAALRSAWAIAQNMLRDVPVGVIQQMIAHKTRLGIIGVDQRTTQMPEYRTLDTEFPLPDGQKWDDRARGLGATPYIPLSTVAEENILCYQEDGWFGESILVHEFSHTVMSMGLDFETPGFRASLEKIYKAAIKAGLWKHTYAAENVDEFWAEGVQDYFNTNLQANPADGIHNRINTRSELESYNPSLHHAIEQVFGPRSWTPACPR